MLKIIFEFIVCLLSVYGAICMGTMVVDLFSRKRCERKAMVRMLLLVKDQEETVEGIIRGLYKAECFNRIIPGSKLTVVDMGSGDKTVEILHRLKKEYENMVILEYGEKEKAFMLFSHGLN